MRKTQKVPYIVPGVRPQQCAVDGCDLGPVVGSRYCVVHIPTKKMESWEWDSVEKRQRCASKGWIYFVLAVGTETVKIGKSTSIQARLSGMKTDCPHELLPLLVMEAEDIHKTEKAIHESLSGHRVRGEWFRLSDDVIELIEYARDNGEKELVYEITTAYGKAKKWAGTADGQYG